MTAAEQVRRVLRDLDVCGLRFSRELVAQLLQEHDELAENLARERSLRRAEKSLNGADSPTSVSA